MGFSSKPGLLSGKTSQIKISTPPHCSLGTDKPKPQVLRRKMYIKRGQCFFLSRLFSFSITPGVVPFILSLCCPSLPSLAFAYVCVQHPHSHLPAPHPLVLTSILAFTPSVWFFSVHVTWDSLPSSKATLLSTTVTQHTQIPAGSWTL